MTRFSRFFPRLRDLPLKRGYGVAHAWPAGKHAVRRGRYVWHPLRVAIWR